MMKLESSIKLSLASMMSITTSSSNKVAANDTGRSALSGEFCVTGEESALHSNPFSILRGDVGNAHNMKGKVCVELVGALGRPVCPICKAHGKRYDHPFTLVRGPTGGCPFFYFTSDAWGLVFRKNMEAYADCDSCTKATKERKTFHSPIRCSTCIAQGELLDAEISARYQRVATEEETRRREEEEKAAAEKRLREEKAAKEKRLREEKAAKEKRLREEKAAKEKRLREEKAILERLVVIRKEKADLEAMLREAHFVAGFKQVMDAIRHYITVLVRTMADAAVEATKLTRSIKRSNERKRKLDQFWRKTRTSLGVCPTGVLSVDELGKLTIVAARRAIMESCLPCKLADDAELALDRFVVVQPEAKLVREV